MTLEQYIKEQIEAGIYTGIKDAAGKMAAEIKDKGGEGVSSVTIENVSRGLKLKLFKKAKAISDITDGKVTIEEICE